MAPLAYSQRLLILRLIFDKTFRQWLKKPQNTLYVLWFLLDLYSALWSQVYAKHKLGFLFLKKFL